MARLKTLKPALAALPPRIGFSPGDERAFDRQRRVVAPWRAWYNTSRWQKLRQTILIRDCYTCQKTGRLLDPSDPDPRYRPVVDHKEPHRGDPALFWDPNNLHTLAKWYHDQVKQAEERAASIE